MKFRSVSRLLYAHKIDMGGMPVRQPLPTQQVQQIDPFLHWSALGKVDNGGTVPQGKRRRGLDQAHGISLQLPALTPDIIPCNHAWAVKITGLANVL